VNKKHLSVLHIEVPKPDEHEHENFSL